MSEQDFPVYMSDYTPGDVARFAIQGNHSILHQCVSAYRCGQATWTEAMQTAAIAQANLIKDLERRLSEAMSRQAPL